MDRAAYERSNSERFVGIGVLIDTYDNDGSGLHPYAMLVFNDGSGSFSHYHQKSKESHRDDVSVDAFVRNVALTTEFTQEPHDHSQAVNPLEIGGCSIAVRNSGVATVRLVYTVNKQLSLFITVGWVGDRAKTRATHAHIAKKKPHTVTIKMNNCAQKDQWMFRPEDISVFPQLQATW